MIRTAWNVSRVPVPLELEVLDPLPCGCVAAVFRVGSQDVRVMSLEAKGPYCPSSRHSMGRVVELPHDDEPEG
jgi:hypothetical protein